MLNIVSAAISLAVSLLESIIYMLCKLHFFLTYTSTQIHNAFICLT